MDSDSRPTRIVLGIGALVFTATVTATADDWQINRLMAPTPAQLAAEADGAVVIYDGLAAAQVAAAMDQHFERIENMMFTRIHHPPRTGAGGAVYVEEDGCD